MVHILSTVLSSLLVVATISPSYASSTHSPFNSRHRKETNAQRLARGVSPLPPKVNNAATAVHAAKRGQPSGTSPVLIDYNIQVTTDGNPAMVGFLSKKYSATGWKIFDPITTESDYMVVSIPANTDSSTPAFELALPTDASDSHYPYLGVVIAAGDAAFSEQTTFAVFTAVEEDLNPRGRPAFVGNDYDINQPAETVIWTIGDNLELIPTWNKPDASPATAQLVYAPDLTRLALVADLTAAAATYGHPLKSAIFTLVPVTDV